MNKCSLSVGGSSHGGRRRRGTKSTPTITGFPVICPAGVYLDGETQFEGMSGAHSTEKQLLPVILTHFASCRELDFDVKRSESAELARLKKCFLNPFWFYLTCPSGKDPPERMPGKPSVYRLRGGRPVLMLLVGPAGGFLLLPAPSLAACHLAARR